MQRRLATSFLVWLVLMGLAGISPAREPSPAIDLQISDSRVEPGDMVSVEASSPAAKNIALKMFPASAAKRFRTVTERDETGKLVKIIGFYVSRTVCECMVVCAAAGPNGELNIVQGAFSNGGVDPGPNPNPNPGPDPPNPDPPDPPTPVTQKLWVVLVSETNTRTPAQASVIDALSNPSTPLGNLIKSKGHKFRVYDPDDKDENGNGIPGIDRAKSKGLPYLGLINGKGEYVYEGAFPADQSAAVVLVKKWGGE